MQKISEQEKIITKAKKFVYRLLNFRLRSEYEIREKLIQKGFSTADIVQTIEYFKKFDLIDDHQFTKKWISSRQSNFYGKNRIRFELKQKGIADHLIDEELSAAWMDFSEEEFVCQLVEKRYSQYKKIEPQKRKKRLYDFLKRRGYADHIIMKVLNRYDC